MANILITGGTGVVGRHLTSQLQSRGHAVMHLSRERKSEAPIPTYSWDLEKYEIDAEAIQKADYIIHLAGANIGDRRWTASRKKLIVDSRVRSARLLLENVKALNIPIKAFISASAVGYYGAITSDSIFTESDMPAQDFLGDTCQQWEAAVDGFEALGIRTVKLRTGMVLSSQGAALAKMLTPVRLGVATPLGDGTQYIPWIHIDDLCAIYIKAIEDSEMCGAYNAVSPSYISNRDFIKTIAQVLQKPFWNISVPSFVLKLLFGQMSDIFLCGSRVSADKIIQAGYSFRFPDLQNALKNLLK